MTGIFPALLGAGTSILQARALQQQSIFEREALKQNARMAELQAQDALRRGEQEATKSLQQTRQLMGAQRAALAAQGIEIDSGSSLDILMDTGAIGASEAVTIRNNAFKEAFGFTAEAGVFRTEAGMARRAGRAKVASTLLTGGIGLTKALFPKSKSQTAGTEQFIADDETPRMPSTFRFRAPGSP
jgi:hypothetical protein